MIILNLPKWRCRSFVTEFARRGLSPAPPPPSTRYARANMQIVYVCWFVVHSFVHITCSHHSQSPSSSISTSEAASFAAASRSRAASAAAAADTAPASPMKKMVQNAGCLAICAANALYAVDHDALGPAVGQRPRKAPSRLELLAGCCGQLGSLATVRQRSADQAVGAGRAARCSWHHACGFRGRSLRLLWCC